jgi:hypothetical protein
MSILLSGIGLCFRLITSPEESAECGMSECDHKTSNIRRPWPIRGYCAIKNKVTAEGTIVFFMPIEFKTY